ncbi:unnamed protein product [Thelazia callipaeda]|uniref:C-mannosyltransferase DPY19L3 n=1 Tax=Thelazia callipaeda TaxID=103827 RepID=A0A0N5D038_THECL|nr:unnamed protein product [Thelazia callipaeda]
MDYEIPKSLKRIPLSSYRIRSKWRVSHCSTCIGIVVGILAGFVFGKYMQEMHETKHWFSHISQVEREISLRTETGLYYSFYKIAVDPQMTISKIIYAFLHDNSTEYPREINVFKRFNIYQEVFLAFLYRFFASFQWLKDNYLPEPILFYVYSCFTVVGFGVTNLFFLTWSLTGNWLYGLLVSTWMLVNYDDNTRAYFAVNLRENFALPFFWLQNVCAVVIMQRPHAACKKYYFVYILSTFSFALFWQFSQFILVLQSISMVGMCLIIPQLSFTVVSLLLLQSLAFFLVILAQFGQPMAVASICTTFNLSAVIIIYWTNRTKRNRFGAMVFKSIYITILTLLLSTFTRYFLGAQSDSHIWTFMKVKVGLISRSSVPFETALYVCHGAFAYLDTDFFRRTSLNGCFPSFVAAVLIIAVLTVYSLVVQCYERRFSITTFRSYFGPETVFVVNQSVLCGVIAVFTLRMKYLWFPLIALVASLFPMMISKKFGRLAVQGAVVAAVASLLYTHYDVYTEQMADEQVFYDPNTVQLMEWIKHSTEPHTSWAGSMQLMAGVKACTGRYLAIHPQFEDKWLRDRTLQLYQMYGRKNPGEIYEILKANKVDYIILEDSICLAPSTGCSTNDLVDIANGDTPDYVKDEETVGLQQPVSSRFCDQIRNITEETKPYFDLVFKNPTFRVYHVLNSQ